MIGGQELTDHLRTVYDIDVRGTALLDLGVHRVDLGGGERWVARVRPPEAAANDVALLRFLEAQGFSAERPATIEPLSFLGDDAVIVTRFVAGVTGEARRQVVRDRGGLAAVGAMVGQLAELTHVEGAPDVVGGAWHHLGAGGPEDEVAAASVLLLAADDRIEPTEREPYERLVEAVDGLDPGVGLPVGLAHPDPVLANIIASPDEGLILVDWAGSGRAPRLWGLGWLMWAEGAKDKRRAERILAGYRRYFALDHEELDRLAAVARTRCTTIAIGAWHAGRLTLDQAAARSEWGARIADEVADHIRSLAA